MTTGTGKADCISCGRTNGIAIYWDGDPWARHWRSTSGQKCFHCGSSLDAAGVFDAVESKRQPSAISYVVPILEASSSEAV
jgi:hypothetical protein